MKKEELKIIIDRNINVLEQLNEELQIEEEKGTFNIIVNEIDNIMYLVNNVISKYRVYNIIENLRNKNKEILK